MLCPGLSHSVLSNGGLMDCSQPGFSVHGDFSRQEDQSQQPDPPPGDLPKPGIQLRSPILQVSSSPPEPPGKPMNAGVGSLSLLQGVFLTQELNWGLLHCRQILYQLSYKGSLNVDCLSSDLTLSMLFNISEPQFSHP